MAIKGVTFLCIDVTLATLRDIGKTLYSNNKLIKFAKRILIVLPNTFVRMLLGPITFLLFTLELSLEFHLEVQV